MESFLQNFKYVGTVLLLPFGINLVAFLLNIESIVRYRKSTRMLIGGVVILTILAVIIYGLNMRIGMADGEITDGKIVLVSVILVVVGFIFSMSPHWILNKHKLN